MTEFANELDHFLSTQTEQTDNVLMWWTEHHHVFPRLSRMALDYLSIPGNYSIYFRRCICTDLFSLATSVDVERLFSKGWLLLSHVRSRLSAQSTRSVLCLGSWRLLGLVKNGDVAAAAALPEVEGDDSDYEMEEGWDAIQIDAT